MEEKKIAIWKMKKTKKQNKNWKFQGNLKELNKIWL